MSDINSTPPQVRNWNTPANPAHTHPDPFMSLLNMCDVSAAAFHRFHNLAWFTPGLNDQSDWVNYIIGKGMREFCEVRDKLIGVGPTAVARSKQMFEQLARSAYVALQKLGFKGDNPFADLTTPWLIAMWCEYPYGGLPAPQHETFLLPPFPSIEVQNDFNHYQCSLISDWHYDRRGKCLDLFARMVIEPPGDLVERNFYFVQRSVGDGPKITNAQLFDWIDKQDPSPEGGEPPTDASPKWTALGEAKRTILTVLKSSTDRLHGPAIAVKAGYKDGTLRHHYSDLQRLRYIDNTKDGYGITKAGADLVPPCKRV